MSMSRKDIAVYAAVGIALLFGGVMIVRSLSGGVSDGELKSMFSEMPTDELIRRRATLAAMLKDSPATEPKSAHRLKYEEGLEELDQLLRKKGVDPETIQAAAAQPRDDR